jgi:hypothetical protein
VTTSPLTSNLLHRIAHGAYVKSADRFVVAGEQGPEPERSGCPSSLRTALAQRLYQVYYLGDPNHRGDTGQPLSALEDPGLGRRLRTAHRCRGHWRPGWSVAEKAPAERVVVVARGGLWLHAVETDVRPRGAPVGAPVAVRFPADQPYASPGFYAVTGSAGPPRPSSAIARLYMNLRPAGVDHLLPDLTARLDRPYRRYQLKVLNHPAAYPRPDALVIYAARGHVAPITQVIRGVVARHRRHVGSAVPGFTRQITAGVAIADDPSPAMWSRPGTPLSFGQHRCGLVADGLIAAGPGAESGARLAAIVDVLSAAGLDVGALHLNPGKPEFQIGALG